MVLPQERSFELRNGLVLTAKHWKTGGDCRVRDARRFLAFHGFLDNAASFDLLAPLMLQQLGPEPVEIVALDLAGHGMSSHRQSEDYGLWRYVEDADQVVEQLGWQKHALIGHSMGGAAASMYAGLFGSRLTVTILLDNFGPFTRSIEDQPDHLLEHIQEKKNMPNKRLPFHPTIDSACQARSKSGQWEIEYESAKMLVPRGLRPVERTDEQGNTVQGWTWSTDQLLTIRSAQSLSEKYVQAFVQRITSPVLAVLASRGVANMMGMVEERKSWMTKTEVTIKVVEGGHSVHMEDAPAVAREVCPWILAQDIGEVARL
ncbi:hypothetical protein BGZ59_000523 [Podila verticillata]|nr:hypothetical protein BGZ59_000523 [Podila verticillata]